MNAQKKHFYLSFHLSKWPLAQWICAQTATTFVAIVFLLLALLPTARAGPGHSDETTVTSAASPRITSHSDLFELVGVIGKGEMTVYLDRYASNEPVKDAKIDIEIGNIKGVATAQADGSYLFKNDVLAKPGELSVSFTVYAGKDTDLLAGDLKIGNADNVYSDKTTSRSWLRWLSYLAGALLLIVITVQVLRKRRAAMASHPHAAFLVAACVLFMGVASTNDVLAGSGHDHGEAAVSAGNSNTPKRQLDGNVFLPKSSQRQLLIRTEMVEEKSLPKSMELTGRVVADANAGGKVQPTQAGRVEAGPRGLPTLGQAVRKGEVLAVVRASSSAIERANQQSQTSELRNNLELAKKIGRASCRERVLVAV